MQAEKKSETVRGEVQDIGAVWSNGYEEDVDELESGGQDDAGVGSDGEFGIVWSLSKAEFEECYDFGNCSDAESYEFEDELEPPKCAGCLYVREDCICGDNTRGVICAYHGWGLCNPCWGCMDCDCRCDYGRFCDICGAEMLAVRTADNSEISHYVYQCSCCLGCRNQDGNCTCDWHCVICGGVLGECGCDE